MGGRGGGGVKRSSRDSDHADRDTHSFAGLRFPDVHLRCRATFSKYICQRNRRGRWFAHRWIPTIALPRQKGTHRLPRIRDPFAWCSTTVSGLPLLPINLDPFNLAEDCHKLCLAIAGYGNFTIPVGEWDPHLRLATATTPL